MKSKTNCVLSAVIILIVVSFFTSPSFALEETGGIGLKIAQLYDYVHEDHRGSLVVLDVFKGYPAEEGGVQKGDIITHIDGELTRGKDFKTILYNELRGESATQITLKLWRASTKNRFSIKMTRVPTIY
jgi:C-terminal processing protease CtpA/Prc